MSQTGSKGVSRAKTEERSCELASAGFAPRPAHSRVRAPKLAALDELAVLKARLAGGLRKKRIHFDVIDLFAGAAGMSLGFGEAFGHGFKSVWANDFNLDACRTFEANSGTRCLGGDIVDLLENSKIRTPRADVVIGGPPCQGSSLLNVKVRARHAVFTGKERVAAIA